MNAAFLVFFKKTYKLLAVILAVILFFVFYNIYLVDRSLSNLRFALNRINEVKKTGDAKKFLEEFINF